MTLILYFSFLSPSGHLCLAAKNLSVPFSSLFMYGRGYYISSLLYSSFFPCWQGLFSFAPCNLTSLGHLSSYFYLFLYTFSLSSLLKVSCFLVFSRTSICPSCNAFGTYIGILSPNSVYVYSRLL